MPSSTAVAVRYNVLARDLGAGLHEFGPDTLAIALSNAAPNFVLDETLADASEIVTGGGYVPGGVAVPAYTFVRDGARGVLTLSPFSFLADGDVSTWRWAILYNATSSRLILSWDYGAPGVAMGLGDEMQFGPLFASLVLGRLDA